MNFTKPLRWLSNYSTSHLLLMVAIVQIIALAGTINCLQFHYPDFTASSGISFEATSNVSGSTAWLLPDPNENWATDPSNDSATLLWSGWMAYDEAITFMDSENGKANSFNTSFTFKLITSDVESDSPSGMAFFISSTGSRPWNAMNRYFGLSNGTEPASFVAVEFDTRASSGTTDPSGSHVGIDINSVNSSIVADTSNVSTGSDNMTSFYPQLYLYNHYTFRAWIAYNATSNLTTVWMTNETTQYAEFLDPPSDLQPIIEYEFDLYSAFSAEDMYVGFAAATQSDSAMLGVAIYSWYFSITEDNSKPAPAPAPAGTPPPPPEISATSTSPPPSSTSSPDKSGTAKLNKLELSATAVLVLILISEVLFWI